MDDSTSSAPGDVRTLGTLWWVVPAASVLLLVTVAMLFGKEESQRHRTSYDAGPGGFRAAYLLLYELDYPVARGRRLGGSAIRWALFPQKTRVEDVVELDHWVRQGGVLLLADDTTDFAEGLGMHLVRHNIDDAEDAEVDGLDVGKVALGSIQIDCPAQKGVPVVHARGKPLVTVYRRDQGEIWLLHRPELVNNELIRKAGNGVLVCRLAERMLQPVDKAHVPDRIVFDEYFHGLRDRPGVTELLLQPPALWSTLHGLLLLVIVLGRSMPRFGPVRKPGRVARRSRGEFLEAMAALLQRKRDFGAAFGAVQAGWRRQLEQALGLPAGTPAEIIAREAAQRQSMDQLALYRLLDPDAASEGYEDQSRRLAWNETTFTKALNEMEDARDEFFRHN